MPASLPLFIGLRYLLPQRRNLFASVTTLFSVVGLLLGISALIIVMSVMNGFETELRSRILGMSSHVTLSGRGARLDDWAELEPAIRQHAEVIGSAPFIAGQGLLMFNDSVRGVMVRGVLPAREPEVSTIADNITVGRFEALKPGAYGIVLGRDLADALGVWPGDKVTLVTPQANVTPAGVLPRLRRFTVVAIFEAGHFDFDSQLALIHLRDAAKLYRFGDQVSGLRLRVDDLFRAAVVGQEVSDSLAATRPEGIEVSDWTREHANFFGAVRTEQTVMFILLSLVVAVAAFNIVVTLVMVVSDKEADIAILRTFGTTPGAVMAIFVIQGVIIGVLGTVLGTVTGVLLAQNLQTVVGWIESGLGVDFFPAELYYISDVPSELHWSDVQSVVALSLVLCLLAAIYPAWRASRVQPAQSLRYE